MTDADARAVLLRVWGAMGLPAPTTATLQAVQAVGRFEGFYGDATKPEGWAGSNNWGAIQCGHPPPCGDDCFEAGDHHANGTPYVTCFRRYASPDDGARALVNELWRRPSVRAALPTGDLTLVARTMRNTGYHETAVGRYAGGLYRNAQALASGIGEALSVHLEEQGLDLVELAVLAFSAWGLWKTFGTRRKVRR